MSIIEKALKKAGDRGLLEEREPSTFEARSVDQFVVPDLPVAPVAEAPLPVDLPTDEASVISGESALSVASQLDVAIPNVDSVTDDLVSKPETSKLVTDGVSIEPEVGSQTSHTNHEDWSAAVDFANQIDTEDLFESDKSLLGIDQLPNVDATVYKARTQPDSNVQDNLVSHSEIRSVVAQKIIESPSDTKSTFNNYVTIDWAELARQGFLDNNDTKSQLSEEFRVIKRPLVNNIQSSATNGISRANLILICSSLPNEGKTFVSINLAISIANERDRNVLLIDADVEKPSISRQLGIKQAPGLIEYLEDENVSFSDILLKTDCPNLSVIPAGNRHKYSTELLSSQRMHMFAEEVSQRYPDRVVIFDTPPLLVATQAHALAQFVGQVILVVAAEATPQSAVSESVAKLSDCDVVMTVLNKTRKDFDIYGYGYGYGTYGR